MRPVQGLAVWRPRSPVRRSPAQRTRARRRVAGGLVLALAGGFTSAYSVSFGAGYFAVGFAYARALFWLGVAAALAGVFVAARAGR